jgi:hypothetical protein
MKLSIIIVSWNVRKELVDCLRSIENNKPCCEFEIIVADNASSDGTVQAVQREFTHATVIANRDNRGFSAANNQAIKIAKGEYLLLLNPDTIVHKNSFDNLIRVLDEKPDAGMGGPKLIDENGILCPSIGYVPTFRSTLYSKTFLRTLGIFRRHYKKLTAQNFNYDEQNQVEQLNGAALMVRRAVMDKIGNMDENFFLYYEDVDLCLRIRNAGFKIIYVPTATITHIGGMSSTQISAKKLVMLYKSMFVYLRKHKGSFKTTLFGLIFKPGVIIKYIWNIFTGFAVFIISTLLFDSARRAKSFAKVTNATIFLVKYSWEFIFRT